MTDVLRDPDELSPALRARYAALRCAPWTEIKTATAVLMLPLTGLFLIVAGWLGRHIDGAVLDSWLLFLTGAWGIAAVAQGWKQNVAAKVAANASAKEGA